MPEFYVIFARKINSKIPEFYMIIARKIFLPIFFEGGGQVPSATVPPSPTPLDWTARDVRVVVIEIEVQMPSFRADVLSFLQFVGLRRSVMIYTDLEVVFKPLAADGLLLSGTPAGVRSSK